MFSSNHALARLFQEMASMYEYLGAGERFRALAYAKAARVVDGLTKEVADYDRKQLDALPGIGKGIAEKCLEFARTGKVRKHAELKRLVPYELMGLMQVRGFGPASLRQLHEGLGIRTQAGLLKALQSGRVSRLKGFGAKKVEAMLRGLKLRASTEGRILLWEAMEIGEKILAQLRAIPAVKRIELAGSVRRRKETIGDLDLLLACAPGDRKRILGQFLLISDRKRVLQKGDTKASLLLRRHELQVDLRVVNEQEWGAALLYFTGSKEHNIFLRTRGKQRGWKINEYGVFRERDGKRLAGADEEDIYRLFGMSWIPPELRENRGEFALAEKHRLPELIEEQDIRGDLHSHSSWSDGQMSIPELATRVKELGRYDYFVLTDHSRSERIAGGLNEQQFLRQIREIDRVNKQAGGTLIRKGVEVDILADGSLDLPDRLLEKFDWVCASIHAGLSRDNTDRLLAACRNPYVNCIGHPSGRLIGKRDAYPVDWTRVFRAARETGTALEINAQPDRMDLNEDLARRAVSAGVQLVISTDNHAPDHFRLMRLGVAIARRAGCSRDSILNTGSWKKLEAFVEKKRNKLLKS